MIWSKIKKAINSTLGTSGFKPLDKIITDSFSEIVKKQNEMKNALETGENNYIVEFAKGAANIEYGSYVGTGTYGKSAPNILTSAFPPKLVVISNKTKNEAPLIMVVGCSHALSHWYVEDHTTGAARYRYNTPYYVRITWTGNTVSWSSKEDATVQKNTNGDEYVYLFIE